MLFLKRRRFLVVICFIALFNDYLQPAQASFVPTSFNGPLIKKGGEAKISIGSLDPPIGSQRFKELTCGCYENETAAYVQLLRLSYTASYPTFKLTSNTNVNEKISNIIRRLNLTIANAFALTEVSRDDEGLSFQCVFKVEGEEHPRISRMLTIGTVYDYGNASISRTGLQSLTEGQNFNVSCQAEGHPKPEVLWLRNGARIKNSSRLKTALQHDKDQPNKVKVVLQIQRVSLNEAGLYECRVDRTAINDVVVLSFQLEVKYYRNASISRTGLQSLEEGQNFNVTCQAEGYPKPEVLWLRNGARIKNSSRLTTTLQLNKDQPDKVKVVLQIHRVSLREAGLYECRVNRTAINDVVTFPFQLEVKYYRNASISRTGLQSITEGQNFNVTCQAEGHPKPEVLWLRNGARIKNSSRLTTTLLLDKDQPDKVKVVLQIHRVSLREAGLYECRVNGTAINDGVTFPFQLEVKYIRRPLLNVKDAVGKPIGTPFYANCKCEGYPLPNVIWLRNNRIISHGAETNATGNIASSTFTIRKLEQSHSANYLCHCSSIMGKGTASFDLTVFAPLENISVNYTCNPEGNISICITKKSGSVMLAAKNYVVQIKLVFLPMNQSFSISYYGCYEFPLHYRAEEFVVSSKNYVKQIINCGVSKRGRSKSKDLLLYSPIIVAGSAIFLVLILYMFVKKMKKITPKAQVTPERCQRKTKDESPCQRQNTTF